MPTFEVRVTALYGPLKPSLSDLSGQPADGYDAVASLADGPRPHHWFVERNDEFSPPLLVLGALYEIDAGGQWEARLLARERFAAELAGQGLPLAPDEPYAELADGGGLGRYPQP